jgi:hypothetical protein
MDVKRHPACNGAGRALYSASLAQNTRSTAFGGSGEPSASSAGVQTRAIAAWMWVADASGSRSTPRRP